MGAEPCVTTLVSPWMALQPPGDQPRSPPSPRFFQRRTRNSASRAGQNHSIAGLDQNNLLPALSETHETVPGYETNRSYCSSDTSTVRSCLGR